MPASKRWRFEGEQKEALIGHICASDSSSVSVLRVRGWCKNHGQDLRSSEQLIFEWRYSPSEIFCIHISNVKNWKIISNFDAIFWRLRQRKVQLDCRYVVYGRHTAKIQNSPQQTMVGKVKILVQEENESEMTNFLCERNWCGKWIFMMYSLPCRKQLFRHYLIPGWRCSRK